MSPEKADKKASFLMKNKQIKHITEKRRNSYYFSLENLLSFYIYYNQYNKKNKQKTNKKKTKVC